MKKNDEKRQNVKKNQGICKKRCVLSGRHTPLIYFAAFVANSVVTRSS